MTVKTSGSIALPQILAQPQPQIIEPGGVASFAVVLADTQGVTYQWRFNGNPVGGATKDALLLTNVSAANEGLYSVDVTNSAGSVTSAAANLYIDSDGDGMADSWEQSHFGNLNQTATGDFDGDGVSNLDEFLDGTDPTSSSSVKPRLTLTTDGGGEVSASPNKLSYNLGEVVTLTATADPPNTFHGWSGDLTTQTSPGTVTMTASKSVEGHFIGAPLPSGVISWWRAENNALDTMGANNGVLANGASFATGKVGQGFALNGTNQSVDIADSPSLRPVSITLEAWVMFNSTTGLRHVFAKPLGSGTLDSFGIWLTNGLLTAGIADNSNFGNTLTASFSPAPGAWHHVAFTFDNATKAEALYIDGLRVSTGNAGRSIAYDSQPVLLGRDIENGSPNYFLQGEIDEATIYSRALTADEIATIYAGDCAGKSTTQPYFTSPSLLPDVIIGTSYNQQLTAALGAAPLTYALSSSVLPPGLSLSSGGVITGTPTVAGTYFFSIGVTDANGQFALQLFSLHVVQPVMIPGLVAWWRAENNALDATGTYNGTLTGGVTFTTGKVGSAFNLDGTTGFVAIPSSAGANPTGPFSVEVWIKANPQQFSSNHFFLIVDKSHGGIDSTGWEMQGNPDGTVGFGLGQGGGGATNFTGATTNSSVLDDQWHHLVGVYTGAQVLFYKDGILENTSGPANPPVANSRGMEIGRWWGGSGSPERYFHGLIDEVTIYSRALSATEVASLSSAGAAGKVTVGPYINTSSTLPDAIINQSYNQTITAIRGTPPITYTVVGGTLPTGVTLSSAGGLSGTPTVAGTFSFTVRATDSATLFAEQLFALQVYAPVAPPGGLVSWWRAENNALDFIGPNNGTLQGGAAFATGKVGQAFNFNGANQYVLVPNSASLQPQTLSVDAWVFPRSVGDTNDTLGGVIFSKDRGTAPGSSISYGLFGLGNTGRFTAQVQYTDSTFVNIPSTDAFTFNQWYHVAMTWDGSALNLYVNGILEASTSVAAKTVVYTNDNAAIGRHSFGGRSNDALIDEVEIFNRTLGGPEIQAIYSAGPAGQTVAGPYFNTPPALPDAVAFSPYSQTLTVLRGTGAINFALTGGSLPTGLTLSSGGLLSGTSTTVGSFTFTLHATDSNSMSVDQTFTLQVLPRVSPPAGIISWWRAENNASDSIGTNNGTLTNGATFGAGKVGQAFSFDGVDDYVNIADSPTLRPASITLEAWVNFSSATGVQHVFAKAIGSGPNDSYVLWLQNGTLNGFICDSAEASNPISIPFAPVVGRWYHVAFTFDNTTKQQWLYLNGVAVATGISNRSIGYDTHPVLLGGDIENGNPALFLNGRIDEAAIYNRALSAGEIAALYGAGGGGKTTAGPYINTPPQLSDGVVSLSYTQTITALRGAGSIVYTLVGGTLPPGLTLSSGGLLNGTPTSAGDFNFVVRATDTAALFGDQSFTLHIFTRFRVPTGLVSWWRAENNALDSIGTNNGTLTNGATFAAGKVGQAFSLDGVDDYVSIPDAPSLRPASVSLEAWVMFNAGDGTRIIMSKPLGAGIFDSYALWLENGNLKAVVDDTTGLGAVLSCPFDPILGRWYHVAFTFDGPTKQQVLYLDGITVASGTGTKSPVYDNHPVLLGSDIDNGTPSFFFSGEIDEAAIYNRAVTAQEINSIHNAGAAGKRLFTSYETWKLANLGNADALDSADPDGDGLPNLIEYALNTNPTTRDAPPSATLQTNGNGSHQLVISIMRDPTRNDVTIVVESSGDLQSWAPIATSTNGSAFTGTANISGEVGGTAPRLVTIVDPNIVPASGGKRFLHIKVSH